MLFSKKLVIIFAVILFLIQTIPAQAHDSAMKDFGICASFPNPCGQDFDATTRCTATSGSMNIIEKRKREDDNRCTIRTRLHQKICRKGLKAERFNVYCDHP